MKYEGERPLIKSERLAFADFLYLHSPRGKKVHAECRDRWLRNYRKTPEGLAWHRDVMKRAMRKYRAKLKAQREALENEPKI